jgi:hypothetical protein
LPCCSVAMLHTRVVWPCLGGLLAHHSGSWLAAAGSAQPVVTGRGKPAALAPTAALPRQPDPPTPHPPEPVSRLLLCPYSPQHVPHAPPLEQERPPADVRPVMPPCGGGCPGAGRWPAAGSHLGGKCSTGGRRLRGRCAGTSLSQVVVVHGGASDDLSRGGSRPRAVGVARRRGRLPGRHPGSGEWSDGVP